MRNEHLIAINCILYLERMLKELYKEESKDRPLHHAIEIMRMIANAFDDKNRLAIKSYEYLTSSRNYEEFTDRLHERDWVELVLDYFDSIKDPVYVRELDENSQAM